MDVELVLDTSYIALALAPSQVHTIKKKQKQNTLFFYLSTLLDDDDDDDMHLVTHNFYTNFSQKQRKHIHTTTHTPFLVTNFIEM